MQTDTLHDDATARISTYRELDHETVAADELRRWQQASWRPDSDVQRDVLRALFLDSLVPMTVEARVHDGIVTLSGTVDSEWEREDATYLASCVPGVLGIVDDLSRVPRPGLGDQTIREAVAAALAHTVTADLADLTVDAPYQGTVVLSGAVSTRDDHDLAIATARSVADVDAVDDCIHVEY